MTTTSDCARAPRTDALGAGPRAQRGQARHRALALALKRPLYVVLLGCAATSNPPPTAATKAFQPSTAATPAPPSSPPLPPDPSVVSGRLSNGFSYYVQPANAGTKRVELMLAVKAGSLHEDDDQLGYAHLLEHLAFSGTRRFSSQSICDLLDVSDCTENVHLMAYAQHDRTLYFVNVPSADPERLSKALDVIEDWAGGLSFESEPVTAARAALLVDQQKWSEEDRPREQYLQFLFAGSRYAARSALGGKTKLESGFARRIVDYYERWYRPERMALIAVGDVNPAHTVAAIESRFAKLAARAPAAPEPNLEFSARGAPRATLIIDAERPKPMLTVGFKLAARRLQSEADYRARVLATMAAIALLHRLRAVAESSSAPFTQPNSDVLLSISGGVDLLEISAIAEEGRAGPALEALLVEIERLRRHGLTEVEVDGIKSEYATVAKQEASTKFVSVMKTAMSLAEQFVTGNIAVAPEYDRDFTAQALARASAADLNRAINEFLRDGEELVMASGAKREALPKEEALLAAVAAAATREVAP